MEEPRVTRLDGEYIITYSAYSRNSVRIALAKTKDSRRVERISLITQADYRNVVIFPEKSDGLYAKSVPARHMSKPNQGWLSIYHGVFKTMDGSVYRLGVALHDLLDPANVLLDLATGRPLGNDRIRPQRSLHLWSCSRARRNVKESYWGAADTVMCVGETNISDLISLC